jgi:hypothetical protein
VTRTHLIGGLCGFLAGIAFVYFTILVTHPEPIARILLTRDRAQKGWTPGRLARRVRALALAGVVLAGAAIVLAVKLFIG